MSARRSIKLAENNGAKVAKIDKKGKEDDDEKEIDWNLCFICKTQGSEKFICHQMFNQSVQVKLIMIYLIVSKSFTT